MHEFSIASQIWQSVARKARQRGAGRVVSITLELGELNLLEEEQLRFWIGELAARDGSPGVDLKVTSLKGRLHCRDCGAEAAAAPDPQADHLLLPMLTCPHCGSQEVDITGGREIRVVSAEISAEAETTGQQ